MVELEDQDFEVNLNNESGAKIVKSSFNAILCEEENSSLDNYG